MERKYNLLGVLQSYAPTIREQTQCAVIYHKMESAGESDTSIETALAQMISDGLTHGNWPWVIAGLTTDRDKVAEQNNLGNHLAAAYRVAFDELPADRQVEARDTARDWAIDQIVDSGRNAESEDYFGRPVTEEVQTALEIAYMRLHGAANISKV